MSETKTEKYTLPVLGSPLLFFLAIPLLYWAIPAYADILNTVHNLSASGPGIYRAAQEEKVCVFCHTPHHADPAVPLWNHKTDFGTVYSLYQSSTLSASPGQPTGSSRLCLSCHDGTIALGQIGQGWVPMQGGDYLPLSERSNLSTDLSDDHPISFVYDSQLASADGQLVDPLLLPPEIRLDEGVLQCTSCHDPHDNTYGNFLVMSNVGSLLCISCHDLTGWTLSKHYNNPEGCSDCHEPHQAMQPQRLLKFFEEEETCYQCHKAGGTGKDVEYQFQKTYHHPVENQAAVHDPGGDPLSATYHVECVDCHNPHQADDTVAVAPDIKGPQKGVRGVDQDNNLVNPAQYEYEICYKCHGDNSFVDLAAVPRIIEEVNERLRFDPQNPSYHPVSDVGKGSNVPSLRPGYTVTSRIYCSDCHGSDDSTKAGGIGPNGVHGSIYPHILLKQYEQDAYPVSYAQSNYDLCFTCHDPDILFSPTSAFPEHSSHVQTRGVPCSICHDPHGVPAVRGATTEANAHLINFDTRFVSSGTYDSVSKSCTVSCHPTNPRTY